MQREPYHPAADIILRSSDKELFYSWKNLLSFSSPVFAAMFSLPQPEVSDDVDVHHHDGLPVIDLEEDSLTLDHVLSLCHPLSLTGKQFRVNSIHELRPVLEATMKYDMEHARRAALEELSNPTVLQEDPIGTYVIACQHECREAAQLAAKHTLALPSLVGAYVPGLEKIHAGKLWRLFSYREACATVAGSLAADHTWIVYRDSLPLFECGDGGGEDLQQITVRNPPSRKYPRGRLECMPVHGWWIEYMRRSECALQRWPHGEAVRDVRLVHDVLIAISISKCKQCTASQLVSDTFESFVDIFARKIELRVAEVETNLGF